MKTLFALIETHGPAWDAKKTLDQQGYWEEHRVFMNNLATRGFIVMGGPLENSDDALLIIDARDEAEIDSVLAPDPWRQKGFLVRKELRRWNILLEAGVKYD